MGLATREAYGKALVELGRENKDIVVLDADLSKSTKTADFAKENKDRFINVGIAEQNLMGISAGLASYGKIPFASTFAVFASGRAFEIVRNSICYPNLNVKIAATHAGITVGEDGGSHQSIEDIAIMSSLPNMTVIVPADEEETRQVIKKAVEFNGPIYIRLGRLAAKDIFDSSYDFEIGKGRVLREGKDITLIGTGMTTSIILEAANELALDGIEVNVIHMPTIKPIDEDIIVEAAKKTKNIITVEEHSIIGGLGDRVCSVTSREYPVKVNKIGIEDVFGQSGTPNELLEYYGLTVDNIKAVVKTHCKDREYNTLMK